MSTNPKISVIIPVYKVEKYLKKCINSVLDQEYKNIEIILVDDGSPDNCGNICDKYAQMDTRIKVIHKENGGLSSARNAGLDVATGEYIGFVDSDDYIEPSMYSGMLEIAIKYNSPLVVCGVTYVYENGTTAVRSKPSGIVELNFQDAIIEMNTYRLFDMAAWSKLYRADLFKDIRFPVGKLSEDLYVMYKIFELAEKVVYVPNRYYNYVQRQNSISHNIRINHDFEYAAKAQMEYLEEKYPEMKTIGRTAYVSAVLTVYDFYIKSGKKCPEQVLKHFNDVVSSNIDYVRKAKFLSKVKKIQIGLFLLSPAAYKAVFKIYRSIKRV